MKNLFSINEDERSRILNLHVVATERQYLSEQEDPNIMIAKRIAVKLENAARGEGTNEREIVDAIKEIKDINMFRMVGQQLSKNYYHNNIEFILNDEFGSDDLQYVKEITSHFKSIGILMNYKEDVGGDGNDILVKNSIIIKPPSFTREEVKSAGVTAFNKFPCVPNHPNAKISQMKSGSIIYYINGVVYYDNGRKKLSDGTMTNYTCKDKEFITDSSSTTTTNTNNTTNTNKQRIPQPSDFDLDNYLNQQ